MLDLGDSSSDYEHKFFAVRPGESVSLSSSSRGSRDTCFVSTGEGFVSGLDIDESKSVTFFSEKRVVVDSLLVLALLITPELRIEDRLLLLN